MEKYATPDKEQILIMNESDAQEQNLLKRVDGVKFYMNSVRGKKLLASDRILQAQPLRLQVPVLQLQPPPRQVPVLE